MAGKVDEWAGFPIPIEGQKLVIEPSYLWAKVFDQNEPEEPPETAKLRNKFWSRRWRCEVWVYEEDGKIGHFFVPDANHLGFDLSTLGASDVWGIEQEGRAVRTLGTLLHHHTFKQYMLTGMFLETSKRSGLTYLFRRLKPTAVLTLKEERARILCALCLHPIAYYEDSWAGAMCPTDDVIAHLMLMRGDEPMFWRRASQHPPYRPEAGL